MLPEGALGDAGGGEDVGEVASLRIASPRHREIPAGAPVELVAQGGGSERGARGELAAVKLEHRAQVHARIMRARRAREEAIGEQRAVVARRMKLDRFRRD